MSNESESIRSCMLSEEEIELYVKSVIEQMPETNKVGRQNIFNAIKKINKQTVATFMKTMFNKKINKRAAIGEKKQ